MPYTAEISRANPTCLLFLIDQSGSMQDPFGSGEPVKKKAEAVADAINRLLQNFVIKCAKDEGVRDYFHVGVLGYGVEVGTAFGGALRGRELVPISDIANYPARIEERVKKVDDGAGGLISQNIKFPVWFDPIANGGTPMCQVLQQAQRIISEWLKAHPNCFPPLVVNMTDGESTDGDPSEAALALKNLKSSDGETLLFNLHLSAQACTPIEFPDTELGLPDQYAKQLFQISSALPEATRKIAQQEGYRVSANTRGFTFNADMVAMIKFLEIGTRPSNLR
jgi:hypothetical protein